MYVCVIIIDVGVSLQYVTSYVLSWIEWALEEQGGKKKRVGELGGPASCFFEVYTKWLPFCAADSHYGCSPAVRIR